MSGRSGRTNAPSNTTQKQLQMHAEANSSIQIQTPAEASSSTQIPAGEDQHDAPTTHLSAPEEDALTVPTRSFARAENSLRMNRQMRKWGSAGDVSSLPESQPEAEDLVMRIRDKMVSVITRETQALHIPPEILSLLEEYARNSDVNMLFAMQALLKDADVMNLSDQLRGMFKRCIGELERDLAPHLDNYKRLHLLFPGYSRDITTYRGIRLNQPTSKLYTIKKLQDKGRQVNAFDLGFGTQPWTTDNAILQASKGDVVRAVGYMSTSLVKQRAMWFMNKESKCCIMTLTIPAGTPCVYISALSTAFGGGLSEYELVLFPGTKLLVLSSDPSHLRLRVL